MCIRGKVSEVLSLFKNLFPVNIDFVNLQDYFGLNNPEIRKPLSEKNGFQDLDMGIICFKWFSVQSPAQNTWITLLKSDFIRFWMFFLAFSILLTFDKSVLGQVFHTVQCYEVFLARKPYFFRLDYLLKSHPP